MMSTKREIETTEDRDVAIYNPEMGLRTIAVANAGKRHWRRSGDPEQLYKAVETELREEAKYVVWRDSVVTPSQKDPRLRGKRAGISELKSPLLPAGDPGAVAVHRWRKVLCVKTSEGTKIDDIKLRAALAEAYLRCKRVCEMQPKGTERGTAGTGEFERYTPAEYIELARAMMGAIDLDPASNPIAQKTVRAAAFFTAEDDGLIKEWVGNIWLNPPYHRDLQPAFIDKMIVEVAAGRVQQAIVLTNNSTDTEWFRRAAEVADAICFTSGRVAFTTPDGKELAPTQGQTFFYFGRNTERFSFIFRSIGFGVKRCFEYRP